MRNAPAYPIAVPMKALVPNVLVCTMFVNFYCDVRLIESEITSEPAMIFYNAQVSTGIPFQVLHEGQFSVFFGSVVRRFGSSLQVVFQKQQHRLF